MVRVGEESTGAVSSVGWGHAVNSIANTAKIKNTFFIKHSFVVFPTVKKLKNP
jgi:hypothetical protein